MQQRHEKDIEITKLYCSQQLTRHYWVDMKNPLPENPAAGSS